MQERIVKGKSALYRFDSLNDLSRWLDATPVRWPEQNSVTERASKSWDLNTDYKAAWQLARNGWLEGAQQAQQALKALPQATPQPDTRTDFYGHRPHVARYCAGAPDSMIRYTREAEQGAGKVLTLIIMIGTSAMTDARCMANYGVGLAQYINQLETDGTRVEVLASYTGELRGWRCNWTVQVKRAEQPLDLAVLAFAIGHPAMFRRLIFAAMERGAAPHQYGYGSVGKVTEADVINAPIGAVVLNGMQNANTYAQTPEAALDHITKQIEGAMK